MNLETLIIVCRIKNVKKADINVAINIKPILEIIKSFKISKFWFWFVIYFSTAVRELPINLGVKSEKILEIIVIIIPIIIF